MLLSLAGAFVLLQLYFSSLTGAFPLIPGVYKNSSDQAYISSSDIAQQQAQYAKLVNSSNAIFSQIYGGSEGAFYDKENNVVGANQFQPENHYQKQPYVANGYIGARITNLGQGFTFDQSEDDLNNFNGWPLFNNRYAGAFIAGFFNIEEHLNSTNFPELYKNGYESVIAAIPQWNTLTLSAESDGKTFTLDPSLSSDKQGNITNYSQTLSLENGIVTTQFTWLGSLNVQYDVLAHRKEIHLGLVRLSVSNVGNSTVEIQVDNTIDFNSAQRSQYTNSSEDSDNDAIWMTFQPHQLSYIDGAIYTKLQANNETTVTKGNETITQQVTLEVKANKAVEVTKFVGVASTDIDPDNLKSAQDVLDLATTTVLTNWKSSIDYLFSSHVDAWTEVLQIGSVDITFPSDDLLTLASRASIFHLAANTRPNADGVTAAMSVGGLSSDSYAGLVFWDMDLWMSGGVLPFLPDHAKSFVNYRVHTHDQAKKNIPSNATGAVYPWTSGRFGNCTSTGPCLDYEYHINVAVAYGALQVYLSGAGDDDYLKNTAYPLIEDAASFLSTYVASFNSTLDKYVTHNLTDPDEFANHVDDGAYTNAGIQEVMNWATTLCNHFGKNCSSTYQKIVDKGMFIPLSDNADEITLEYNGMNSSVAVKQADVIMLSYPLDSTLIDVDQAEANLDYYAQKQVSYGPAMTYPIFSAVSSKLSLTGCSSQSYLRKSVQPYLRAPFAQFSEQNNDDFATNGGTHPAFPFMTAHGGILQAVLQGLTGLKFDWKFNNDTNKIQRILKLDPIAIPCLDGGVAIEGVKYLNQTIDLIIGNDNFTIRHNGPSSSKQTKTDIDIVLGQRNEMSDNGKVYTLKPYDEINIPLFKTQPNIKNSVSECADAIFTNVTIGTSGDVSSMMNDGDNTTYWQANSSDSAQILIDLKQNRKLKSASINWGTRPAKSLTLSKLNATDANDVLLSVQQDHNIVDLSKYFSPISKQDVSISAPFNNTLFLTVELLDEFNVTSFKFDSEEDTRYLLLEVEGIHDDFDDSKLGATLNEVSFFE